MVESQLTGILNGFGQLLIAVYQQVFGNLLRGGKQEERYAAQFGIPVSISAVLLAGETFGADIQAGVVSPVCLVELEDVVAYALLGFRGRLSILTSVSSHISCQAFRCSCSRASQPVLWALRASATEASIKSCRS